MIKVLIIEDNPLKIKSLRAILDINNGINHYDISQDSTEARRFLQSNFYDLLILDLNVPKRIGDDPSADNGINLLKELNQGERLVKPANIIGLTEYDELRVKYQSEFENYLWLIILYELKSTAWEQQLISKIDYLIKSKTTMLVSSLSIHQYDLAFITALRTPELDFVLRLPLPWKSFKIPNDSTEYHKAQITLHGQKYSFLAVSAPQMGMVASSALTMKILHSFRPKYLVMTGLAAGVENKCNYGDILVAALAFEYQSGKETVDDQCNKVFEPDYKPIELSRDLLEDMISCQGNREFLDDIKNGWTGDSKNNMALELHIGPLASGGSVIEDRNVLTDIKQHNRKLIGIDMETYGVYYAANNCSKPRPLGVVSIKAVSDFASKTKNDQYQNYASYTSAMYAFKFFTEKVFKQNAASG